MSVYVERMITGKGARARLKKLKRWEAVERQEAAIERGYDLRTGQAYAFADVAEFMPRGPIHQEDS